MKNKYAKKTIYRKTIATILLFVMVFQFIPNIVMAVNEKTNNNETIHSLDENIIKNAKETKEPIVIGELENERTLNEKYFLMSDGTIAASIFSSNIHYEKDGKFFDVDNTLEEVIDTTETLRRSAKDVVQEERVELNSYINGINTEIRLNEGDNRLVEEINKTTKVYTNNNGNTKIKFSNKTSGYNLGSMESDGNTIVWGLMNSKASNIKVKNSGVKTSEIKGKKASEIEIQVPQTTIEYADILGNINIEYSIEPEHVKENIVLKSKEAANNELSFIYDVGSLKMKLLDNKEIIIYDKIEDNVKFTIQSPFMYDGNLEYSDDIEIQLQEEKGRYIITLKPNKEWLREEKRAYPVTIDPSITTSRYYQDIQDTYTYSSQGTSPKGNAHVLRAGNGGTVPSRTLIKFNLPELKAGDQVIGAYLSIFSYPKTTEWTPPTRQIQLDVHKMTSDWSEATATWSGTSSNYNSRVEDYILYQFDYNNQIKQYNFDITTVAKDWYTTGNNYGVMIKEHIEANNVSGNEAYFISANTYEEWYNGRPVVQIIYRNQTGLEDYLSYHVQDLGRAGTVYTNDYNGNLVWVHDDITTPGERMQVTIKHVYNTNDKDMSSRFGNGIRLNIVQTIELVTIGGTDYAEYIDEDGTRHYFTKESTYKYKDEDGLGLELELDTNSAMFIIKDKGDNILRFERRQVAGRYLWHLKEIEDSEGNKIVINFLSTIQDQFIIANVTDSTGKTITFQYSGYYLGKLVGPDGKVLEYTYSSSGTLSNIKYPDGKKAYYDFSSNVLNAVQKVDSTLVKFHYYPDKTKRVKTILEYASDAVTVGNTINVTYSNNLTTFTDNQGYSNNITFNDWGQTISIADFGKGTQDLKNAYGKIYSYGTSGGSKNKLTLDGNLTKTVNNILMNGNAEYVGYWESDNWGNNAGVNSYSTSEAYVGNTSLKITSSETENSVVPFYKQQVIVEKGKTYTLSAKVKIENVISASGNGAMLIAYYVNAAGTKDVLLSETINGTKNWEDIKLTINYPANATGQLYVGVGLLHCTGTAYFDTIQLEEGTIANTYNFIENSTFEYAGDSDRSWNVSSNATSIWDSVAEGYSLFRLFGDVSQRKYLKQNVITSGNAGDTFSVSAWVQAGGTRNRGNVCTTIAINVVGYNNEEQWSSVSINPSDKWQFVQSEFIAQHDYKRIEIYFCFYENVNEAYITKVALYKDEFGQSYQYDSKGNLIKSQDLAKQNNTFNYDENDNLIKNTNPKGGAIDYQYDTTYKHRLIKAISSTGVNYNFQYNQYGQAINSKINNSTDGEYIETGAEYTANGNYLTKLTDQRGNETNYEYNQTTGTLTKVIDAKNTATNYAYDNLNRISTVSKSTSVQNYQNSYTYVNDKLSTITHNGFNYNFIYDNFGNTKQVKIGNQILVTNNYAANNGNLTSAIYGNNAQISYTYDRFNRLLTQTKAQGVYTYEYDAKSNIAHLKSPDGSDKYYTYDLANRLVRINDTHYGYIGSYMYDEHSNVNNKKYTFSNKSNQTQYTYDNNNRITNVNLDNTANIVTNYDILSRISSKQLKVGTNTYTTQYNYQNLENNKTTTSLASVTNGSNNISYTYDALGNIATITEGSTLKATYYYDELSQLIREDNVDLNKTIIYTYDAGGNIVAKTEYPYTTETPGIATSTVNYMYTNINWKDQLTSYNGQAITYDAIGNPLTYNGNTYTWQNGRELAQIVNGSNTYQYKYNEDGIRTTKIVNGTITRYHTEGTKVIYEKKDGSSNIIYYSYDESGNIVGIKYNNTQYYYVKNLQGDIIGLLDNNLNQIVSYKYDSWGTPISIKDANGNEITDVNHIGIINPYRYRSYRYDTETGLYYLNSRYYNPEWGRFINGDSYGGQIGDILSHNIYAYCLNNPINNYDPKGDFAWAIPLIVEGLKDTLIAIVGFGAGVAVGGTIWENIKPKEKAESKSEVVPKEQSKPKIPQYWAADNQAKQGVELTYKEAQLRVAQGENIIAANQIAALALVGFYRNRVIDKAHHGGTTGYYNHYHLNNSTSKPHIWFYGEIFLEYYRVRN